MNTQVEEVGPCRRKISITIPPERIEKAFESVLAKLESRAKVPGFRAGKIPRKIVMAHYGQTIRSETLNSLLPGMYAEAVKEAGLRTVSDPSFHWEGEIVPDAPFLFEATVDVAPEVPIPSYRGIRITRSTVHVSDEEVAGVLESLRERAARFEAEPERPLAEGDYFLFDFTMLHEGKEVESREKVLARLEEDSLFKELVKGMAGMKPSEERVIPSVLPEGYPKREIAGKQVEIHARLCEIKRKVLPDLGDELAKELGDVETLDALRDKIRDDMTAAREAGERERMTEQIVETLLAKAEFVLPSSLLQKERERVLRGTLETMAAHGVPRDTVEKKMDEIKESANRRAERELRKSYVLSEIAKKEGVACTEEELDERIERLTGRSGETLKHAKRSLEKDGRLALIRAALREEKTLAFLLGAARIKVEKKKKE